MPDDLITAATTQSETPTGDAAQSAANYVTAALAAAQLYVSRGLRAAGDAGGPREDPIEAARRIYQPMLGRDRGRQASSSVAMAAWQAALPFADQYRDAARAAGRAEDRLKVLHPDAMARYQALRNGLDPVQAMREVAPLIGREINHPQARADYAVMLGKNQGRDATSQQALKAWEAALPLREHIPDADTAASRAEDRLRELHPEAMHRFDTLRAEHTPTEAARQTARLVDPAYVSSVPDPVTAPTQPQTEPAPATTHDPQGTPNAKEPAAVPARERYVEVVTAALPPELAAAVLADKAWPRLAAALEKAEQAGADPGDLLATVAGKRETKSASSTALVLAHRVEHHEQDPATTAQEAASDAEPATTPDPTATTAPADEPAPAQTETGSDAGDPATAATIAAQNFPVAITDATVAGDVGDIAAVNAAAGLTRDGATVTGTAGDDATTPPDPSTVGAGAPAGTPARGPAAAGPAAQTSQPAAGASSPAAVAAQNFATPLDQATTTQPAPAAAARPVSPAPAATQTTHQGR